MKAQKLIVLSLLLSLAFPLNVGVQASLARFEHISIAPPPWRTWWAYALYALLAVLVVLGVLAYVRYRRRELQRANLERIMWAVQQERDRIAALLETRRQLVASLSHDLRTPVAMVRDHLEAALTDEQDWQPPPRQTLEVMLGELDRLYALLDDLFTLSRLEVDQLALSPGPVDLNDLVRRAVSAMRVPAWQGGKVQVTLEASGPRAWALADEERLMQALMNLLHNAVRHTPPGGVVIVGLDSQDERVAIRVRDTGEGIRPNDLPRIWERFYRGQSQAGGGSGLGLALVKELVEAMGGVVGVESTLGSGSSFTITLPRSEARDDRRIRRFGGQ